MGVGDGRLLQVLVDGSAALLVLALQLDGDLGAAVVLPLDLLLLQDAGLVLLGVDLHFEVVGGAFSPVREMIFTGLPVVSWPYMPAAEMPMPCWPRLMRKRWNLEPYRSLAKTRGIWSRTMPGP